MKKVLAILLVVVMTMVMLAGCGRSQTTKAPVPTPKATEVPVPTPTPAPTPNPIKPIQTSVYKFQAEDKNGYKLVATLEITPFMKYDQPTLDQAWQKLGGSGSFLPPTNNRESVFEVAKAAYLIGRLTYTNPSDEYGIGEMIEGAGRIDKFYSGERYTDSKAIGSGGKVFVYHDPIDGKGLTNTYSAVYYGNSTYYNNALPFFSTNLDALRNGSAKQWGPVRFVLAVSNAFSPNYPNGDAGHMSAAYYGFMPFNITYHPSTKITFVSGSTEEKHPYTNSEDKFLVPVVKSW